MFWAITSELDNRFETSLMMPELGNLGEGPLQNYLVLSNNFWDCFAYASVQGLIEKTFILLH